MKQQTSNLTMQLAIRNDNVIPCKNHHGSYHGRNLGVVKRDGWVLCREIFMGVNGSKLSNQLTHFLPQV